MAGKRIGKHDRDGNGKSQLPSGRIFYTERKLLIFYTYDLADPRSLDARVSFYVLGGNALAPTNRSVASACSTMMTPAMIVGY